MSFNTWVLSRRSNGEMQVSIDFPADWSDITSQQPLPTSKLMMAEGHFTNNADFDVLAVGTYPGIPEAAVTQVCLIGYTVFNEFGEPSGGNMSSAIGDDRDTILAFVNYHWPAKYTELSQTTSSTMTRQAFRLALLAAVNAE